MLNRLYFLRMRYSILYKDFTEFDFYFFMRNWILCFLSGVLLFFSLTSYAFYVIPDEINIPDKIEQRSSEQIKAIFSSLEKQYNQKTANFWRLRYQKALLLKKKDIDSFCDIMKELGDSPAFPLKNLARIQSYELCPFPSEPSFNPDLFPSWLRFRLAEAFYKRRKTFNQPETTLKVTIYLAQNSPYKALRISYLKHALALAKEQQEDLKAQELRQLLYEESPSLNPEPSAENYLAVAEDFRRNRKFKKAIAFYIRVLNSPKTNFDEKNLSFKGLDHIHKIQRKFKKQSINFQQWSRWLLKENTEQSLTKYYTLRLELARQKWNLNENQRAIQLVTDILKDPKSQPIIAEALYLRGLIYAQEKQPELSLKDWNQAIQQISKKRNKSELLKKILWEKAWLLRSQKNYQEALNSFKLMEKINKNPYTRYKILFWKGKTLQAMGQKTLAKRSFETLIMKDHFGYYGLLARKMLNKKPEFQKIKKISKRIPLAVSQKVENMIHWLILFEESQLLSQFLDTQKSKILNRKHRSKQDWLKMIWLWTKAQKYLEIFQSLEAMNDAVKSYFLKKYIHFLFPLDFAKEVKEAGQKMDAPPALIFSVMRQESAFNIRARSPADAFGLMQLIPSTAQRTAKRYKIPYRNFKDLYKPSKNIFLGTAHLKSLLKQYNNSFLFSVAAYNAGSTPLNQWKEEMEELEPLEFIENIPYEETRNYVRLLIRNYVFYHNELDMEGHWFPDWLLQ